MKFIFFLLLVVTTLCFLNKRFRVNSDDDTCEMCQDFIGYIEDMLLQNDTEEAIKEKLEKICDILPVIPNCTDLIDQVFPRTFLFTLC